MLKRTKLGLSFIELVVALFLVNVVFFSFIAFISMALKSSKQGQDVSRGTIVANSLLEDYIAVHRQQLAPMTGIKKFGDIDYDYSVSTQRLSEPASDGRALYKVSISVRYIDVQSGVKGQREVTLSTMIHGKET